MPELVPLPLAGFGLANIFNIGEIAHPAGRELRRDQVRPRNEECSEAACRVDHTFHTPFPCFIENNAVNAGENIDSDRLPSEAMNF